MQKYVYIEYYLIMHNVNFSQYWTTIGNVSTYSFSLASILKWRDRVSNNMQPAWQTRVFVCRAVGSMGQRKSGGLGTLGAAAPTSTEEEQLKFQDSRFLTTLVLGRSRWVAEWLTVRLRSRHRKSGTWSVPHDPLWHLGFRLYHAEP